PGLTIGISSGKVQSLAIRQTQSVHREIVRLLADLRKARRKPGDFTKREVLVRSDQSPAALREEAIRAALDKAVKVDGEERPLNELIGDVASQIGVPLYVDRQKLLEEEIDPTAPTTFRHPDMSARSALALLLKPSFLTWIIRDEVLFITTTARA